MLRSLDDVSCFATATASPDPDSWGAEVQLLSMTLWMSGNYSTYGLTDHCPRGRKGMHRQPSVKSNDPVHNESPLQQLISCLAPDSDHRLPDAKQGNGKQRSSFRRPMLFRRRTFFSGSHSRPALKKDPPLPQSSPLLSFLLIYNLRSAFKKNADHKKHDCYPDQLHTDLTQHSSSC